jgi:hypothetical protein
MTRTRLEVVQLVCLMAATMATSPAASWGFDDSALLSVGPDDSVLRRMDPTTAQTLDESVEITVEGETVEGATGLAVHPANGKLYAALMLQDQWGREVAEVDPHTGVAQSIGDTGELIDSLTFDDSGVLYGVSGELGARPETLYSVSLEDGSLTYILALGAGDVGDVIAFNSHDGLLYYASGHEGDCDGLFSGICFQSIDLARDPPLVQDIPLLSSDLTAEQVDALVYWPDASRFLWKRFHGAGPLFLATPDGQSEYVGETDHRVQDFAFLIPVPEPMRAMLQGAALAVLCLLKISISWTALPPIEAR